VTSPSEDALYASLSDTDSLEWLAATGLAPQCIPTADMRQVVAWAVDQFYRSGRTQAPSRLALMETWGEVMNQCNVELIGEEFETDPVQWAVEQLRAQHVTHAFNLVVREAATALSQAPPTEKTQVLGEQISAMLALQDSVTPQNEQTTFRDGFDTSLRSYNARKGMPNTPHGLLTGMADVDTHTYGLHAGEVAVLAAPPKTGKSLVLTAVARAECERGQSVALFTLENSVEMTIDRLVCQTARISYEGYQRGTLIPEEEAQVQEARRRIQALESDLHVIMPEPGQRSMTLMLHKAASLGVHRVLIDQLTFVEHGGEHSRKARHEVLRDIMHEAKTVASNPRNPMSVMIAHQINREGVKAAAKSGWLSMGDLAEGAEIERTADIVYGLYQSDTDRMANECLLQIMAARRMDKTAWKLDWNPTMGTMRTMYVQEAP
jgi:hypothetical protein